MAIVAAGERERVYLSPTDEQEIFAQTAAPDAYPQGEMPDNPRWFSPPAFVHSACEIMLNCFPIDS